jgi:alginate O-acetyltransferase complex protein AlgJ
LFLTGGSNEVLEFYTNEKAFPDESGKEWVRLIIRRTERAANIGAGYVHLIAPEKLSVYPEYFAGELPFLNRSPARVVESHGDIRR